MDFDVTLDTTIKYDIDDQLENITKVKRLFSEAQYREEFLEESENLRVYRRPNYSQHFIWHEYHDSLISVDCYDDLSNSELIDIYLAHNLDFFTVLWDIIHMRNPIKAHSERVEFARKYWTKEMTLDEVIELFSSVDH